MVKMEFDLFTIMLFSFFNINKIMTHAHLKYSATQYIQKESQDHLYNVLYFSYRLCIYVSPSNEGRHIVLV